jgi:hypothetical protein
MYFIYSLYQPLLSQMAAKTFSHSIDNHFTLVVVFLDVQKAFNLKLCHLSILLLFPELLESIQFRNSLPMPMPWSIFSWFSCSIFSILGLTLRYFTHFGLIFGQSERQVSSFSLLHVDIQLSQYNLFQVLWYFQCCLCSGLFSHSESFVLLCKW